MMLLGEKNEYQYVYTSSVLVSCLLGSRYAHFRETGNVCVASGAMSNSFTAFDAQFPMCAQYEDQAGFAYNPGEPFRKAVNASVSSTTRATEHTTTGTKTTHLRFP